MPQNRRKQAAGRGESRREVGGGSQGAGRRASDRGGRAGPGRSRGYRCRLTLWLQHEAVELPVQDSIHLGPLEDPPDLCLQVVGILECRGLNTSVTAQGQHRYSHGTVAAQSQQSQVVGVFERRGLNGATPGEDVYRMGAGGTSDYQRQSTCESHGR